MSQRETKPAARDESRQATNFIRTVIDDHLASGRYARVVTRFPPEPNGYLHIGHAKAICLNFGLARDYEGVCHLRFDDTNPTKESTEYVDAIQRDIRWLGFEWGDKLFFASDYFPKLYEFAVKLVKEGKAYVDSQTREQIRELRGTLSDAGRPSPFRDRDVEESLALLEGMRRGDFAEGEHVLRARIDMASPNMLMRDPLMYRILNHPHHRTGDSWHIYPMYDFAHGLSDAIEGITHSICTLEFENNRELYDWFCDAVGFVEPRPHQYEFARLGLDYTVMSKRKLLQLVDEGHVSGWDDPRMPTLAGLRRRGVTPEAIRAFCDLVGVSTRNSTVDIGKLDYCIREDLNHRAPRVMAVLDPLEVILSNYPEELTETLDASSWPHDVPKEGTRPLPMARRIYIERSDFMEDPPKRFHRLAPGREVRLRHSYIIKCMEAVKDDAGKVVALKCSYDPHSKSGSGEVNRKVKGTIHWVAADRAVDAEVRLYDRLFAAQDPNKGGVDFKTFLNPDSLKVVTAKVEPGLADIEPGQHVQFERHGYFYSDPDTRPGAPVFNRTVALKDSWKKKTKKRSGGARASVEATVKKPKKADGRKRPEKKSKAYIRARIREDNPELAARYTRYREALKLSDDDAGLLTEEIALADFFEAALGAYDDPAAVAKFVVNVVMQVVKDTPLADFKASGAQVGRLIALSDGGEISSTGAKDVLAEMVTTGAEPERIIDARGLRQVSDEAALAGLVAEAVAANPDKVARYRAGNAGLAGFFVGQVMRATKGAADPRVLQELVKAALDAE